MQAVGVLKAPCGLKALQPRAAGPARRCSRVVVAAKGKAAPPPAEAAPAAPADIPAYFQPAPVAPAQPAGPQGQVYQAAPVPQYGPPPAAEPSFWGRIPPLVYVGVGVVLAGLLGKVMEIVKGGPQKMQEIAMQQMMKQMMKQMGSAPGGANPFAPGASPFGAAPGANPFAPGANPFASPPGGGSGFPAASVFDTTATAAPASAAAPSAAGSSAAASSAAPSSSTATAAAEDKPKKKSAFADVTPGAGAASSSSSGSASTAAAEPAASAAPPPPGGMPPPPFSMPPPGMGGFGAGMGAAGAAGAAGASGATGVAGTMLDMLKNPEMQKMLYPYLPEPMRNPETFEWMLSNPEYRQQLEGMLQAQVAGSGSPAMQEMMAGMDMSPEKMNAQFEALGMKPEEFISKVMGDPDLAGMMTNPKVMAAIAECTKNPMAIFNYQNDPEVLRVFEKMSQLFPQAGGGMGMPPGFGGAAGMPPMPPTQQ